MSTKYPEPPVRLPPRPLDVVQAEISKNVAAQDQALAQGRPDLLYELQERQRALFTERRYAEWAARGVVPHIIQHGGTDA